VDEMTKILVKNIFQLFVVQVSGLHNFSDGGLKVEEGKRFLLEAVASRFQKVTIQTMKTRQSITTKKT
jgi:hypothetical protein